MSKLFTTAQLKASDAYTIIHEPITSTRLIERAAMACVERLLNFENLEMNFEGRVYHIFCGRGNNGADGFAMALEFVGLCSDMHIYYDKDAIRNGENAVMLERLYPTFSVYIHPFQPDMKIIPAGNRDIIIDAVLGTGLTNEATGIEKEMISWINNSRLPVVSIDIPSGLPADPDIPFGEVVKADLTLTLQTMKRSFLYPETGAFCGKIEVLPIGLHKQFEIETSSNEYLIDQTSVQQHYKKRAAFSHKGTFGHALMFAGSHGKMGASVLSTRACVKSGTGLVSVLIPENGNNIMQIAVPEAMTIIYDNTIALPDVEKFDAIGIGCGLGTDKIAKNIVLHVLEHCQKPILLDADALNCISQHPEWLQKIPVNSLLTPHPKEFERLFGESANAFERNQLQIRMSTEHKIFILLKGRYTCISTPSGECWFNITGNPGMATGGSGDVLSGLISGLYAQYKDMFKAAILGVYLHGLAGDLAAEDLSEEALIASDIIDHIGAAYRQTFYATPLI